MRELLQAALDDGDREVMRESIKLALIEHDACKRAWRDTPDGKQWYRLVPIPPPESFDG